MDFNLKFDRDGDEMLVDTFSDQLDIKFVIAVSHFLWNPEVEYCDALFCLLKSE